MRAEAAYFFRHALVRDAAYELQPPGERNELHEKAARVLESVHADSLDPVAREIAQHWGLSGADPDRERDFTFRAALFAVHSFDHDSAIELLHRTTEIGTPTQVLQAHQLLYSSYRAFRHDNAAAMKEAFALWRAARRYGQPGSVSAALNQMAGIAVERSTSLLRRSYRLAMKAEKWLPAAIAIGNLGAYHVSGKDYRRARRLITKSIQLHRRADNTVGIGFFLCALGGAERHLGMLEEARQHVTEGLQVLEGINARRYLPTGYGHLASVLVSFGRHEEAAQVLDRAVAMATEIQLQHEWWKLVVHRALVALELYRPDHAQGLWREAYAWLRERGMEAQINEARADLGRAAERLGQDVEWE